MTDVRSYRGAGEGVPYPTPAAFNAAITARLKVASEESPYTVSQLRRQFAYDRILARVFTVGDGSWILKGGVAMLARLDSARHSTDIDLAASAASPENALKLLRNIAEHDLGDHFTFVLDQPRSLVQGVAGLRIPVAATLGPRPFERFSIDLVTGVQITAPPETSGPLNLLADVPGLVKPRYRLYPLVDTLADKVLAIVERHGDRPSTRFRDLVDIVLIAHTATIEAAALRRALHSEHHRRNQLLSDHFDIPDASVWKKGYERVAADVPDLNERTLAPALLLARAFLDPVLNGERQSGRWDPAGRRWLPTAGAAPGNRPD
ncbi:nucleotidyl transferase AbiEii/AbiGii toxin family protein [Actinomadura gamaensis]|uniref:Nucleotidyl transferase AbiEii/AbiGii toxin family protein n=1 Tax=Actinomadura gamaensis TaxID=1763541 RepID=A0ABV9TNN5_9ACTN